MKEALRRSHGFQMHQSHFHEIYQSTVAVVFFGTPHSGADPRSLIHHIAEKVIQAAGFSVNKHIVDTLLPTSERLRELRDEFSPMAHQKGWIIYSFQEQYGVPALNNKKVSEFIYILWITITEQCRTRELTIYPQPWVILSLRLHNK